MGSPGRPHLLGDEGAGERDRRPEENPAAEDHFAVEAVTQVAEDGGGHHEAADENCMGEESFRGGAGGGRVPRQSPPAQITQQETKCLLRKQPPPKRGSLGQSPGPGEPEQPHWVRRPHNCILFNAQQKVSPSGT